ncbi:MAG: type I polyketide synthase, partial [Candidatus Latescibacteria bacterium]|nr:type I polyketide synthase [Candidatus Latescibacterota bacterium]
MSDAKDRIAIVGMAGRFPGAPDVEQFWQLLKGGVEGIRFFTPEELAAAGVPETLLRNPDFVPANGYLDDVELFDAPFFGMTAREAEMTDPQHRLFLQSSWHALEDAGHVPERFDGRIGVYAGCGWSTYLLFHLFRNPDLPPSVSHLQYLIGNSGDYLPTRVSYRLNLKGPSVNVNTACSSSLVAVHMACQSLLDYECDMALAGGASVQLPQDQGYVHQENTITSPDGHCRAFDAKAAGTVSGNGVGLVVLRRLEDALADGDTIRAVILGSAINNDGADKAGYTAPSISGQAIVVAEAMSVGSVEPDTIQYIETHGTGTQIGDPIEIQALSRVFGSGDRAASCALGSLKTNIGHLDEAAGVAGLMKTVLAMERGQIPPSLHFESPNPETDLENSPFHVNAHLRPWPATDGPRRAGVSSFGIGGTNAHIVLEQAPVGIQPSASRRPAIVPVSARSASALTQARRQLADHLEANPELAPAAVASTLQIGRQAFGWRSAVCGDTLEEIVRELRVDRRPAGIADTGVPVAFLFPGQGSQHPEMAAELYETEPFFRDELDHCCELLRQHAPQESLSFLQPATATSSQALTRTDSAQPALFVVEVALARLWMHWGVKPDYLIGHSLGEYVAACLADVFSLEEAIRIISARGRLMQSMPDGAMLAVPLVEAEAMAYLRPQLDVAAINTSDQTIVSGSEDQIIALEQRLNA